MSRWRAENDERRVPERLTVAPRIPPVSLQGFDEYMNIVLDAAEEVNKKKGTRKSVGRILLKGDNITMMVSVSN